MTHPLPNLDDLPRHNASHVKNRWGDVVRQVRHSGSVAITHHAAVEMVLLDAAVYQQMAQDLQAIQAREQTVLDALAERFDTRLAALQQPGAGERVTALMEAAGRLAAPRPKAGAAF